MMDKDQFGDTFQLLAIHRGDIVFERNQEGRNSCSTSVSWSMAKSWTHALVGHAMLKGLLPNDIHKPVW